MDKVQRLSSTRLSQLYALVDQVRGDEIMAANKGSKAAFTRLRVNLAQVAALCKQVRKEILVMRDGEKVAAKEEVAEEMEKYGVDTEEASSKVASDIKVCPKCGAEVERHGSVGKCANCGTEPFEKE